MNARTIFGRRPRRFVAGTGLIASMLLFTGCAEHESAPESAHADEHDEHGDHDEEAEGGARFSVDDGLILSPEIARALAVATTKVETRPLPRHADALARIFTTTPPVQATAWLDPASAAGIDATWEVTVLDRPNESAGLQRVVAGSHKAELIVTLETTDAELRMGDSRRLRLTQPGVDSAPAATVPASAVLDTANGTFVYLARATAYRRVAIKVGQRVGDRVAILAGIDATDTVVASPVDQLWLTELRLTKGGGHSH